MNQASLRRGPMARRRRSSHVLIAPSHATKPAPYARRDERRAFSLLELTLVLAIIAALMGVAAFALLGQGNRAKVRASEASLRVISTAIGQYQLNHSSYPDTLARLVTAQYLEARSMQDAWKRDFYYRTPGLGGRPYTLLSGGIDGDYNTPADNIDVWTMDAQQGQ
ncbi:MAG: type II secretion system protein GspG [Phycisphaerales bacterium]|nr:type II secretion system protein GspG [Phycisphaerales bacterium]